MRCHTVFGTRAKWRRHIFLCALVSLLAIFWIVMKPPEARAQLSGCPPQDNNVRGWAKCSNVYVDLTAMPQDIQTSLTTAFSRWNNANYTLNPSGVSFAPADATHPATYVVQVGPYQDARGYHPAGTVRSTGAGGVLTSATTNIDINNIGGGWFARPGSSYQQAIVKIMLHEIGHTFCQRAPARNRPPSYFRSCSRVATRHS
jgi:hypothetical protein